MGNFDMWKSYFIITCFYDGSDSKESAWNAGDPGMIKIPWRREWQPTPVFLPGKYHGQRSLAGGGGGATVHRAAESDTTDMT